MIPKTIHYCWFGRNPMPELAEKCMASWKKYCPDYEIIQWNEDNFDLSAAPLYVRQAYEAKKWAFVTDYVRLQVVYEHGGIYLDTDVEIIRPLDSFLQHKAYFGFQSEKQIATGLGFGAEQGSPILVELMADYRDIPFVQEDGSLDLTPCPKRNTAVFLKHGLKQDDSLQTLEGDILVLPSDYLSPITFPAMKMRCTKNTCSIHHFAASWLTAEEKKRIKRDYITHFPHRVFLKTLGESRYERLKKMLKQG